MANDILSSIGTSAALTITIASLTNGSARQATAVTDTSPSVPKVRIYYRITTGTSPTANSLIEFYLARADDDGTEHRDGDVGTSDAAYSGDVTQLDLVHTQPVTSTSNTAYRGSFLIYDPGPDWVIVLRNSTGATLHATAGNHWIRWRHVTPQVQ